MALSLQVRLDESTASFLGEKSQNEGIDTYVPNQLNLTPVPNHRMGEKFTIAAAGVSDASDKVTGITALVSAIETAITSWVVNTLSLDTAQTIKMTALVRKVTRLVTSDSAFIVGTDNYDVVIDIKYGVS